MGQVAVEFPLRHLTAILLPLRLLVAQEEVEDVLAQGLGDQFGALHGLNGVGDEVDEDMEQFVGMSRGCRVRSILFDNLDVVESDSIAGDPQRLIEFVVERDQTMVVRGGASAVGCEVVFL